MYSFSDGFSRENVITGVIDLNVGPGAEYENLGAVKGFLSGKVFAEGAGARLIFARGTHNYPDGFHISSNDKIDWDRVSLVFPNFESPAGSAGNISSVILSEDGQNYLMKIDLADTSHAEVGMFAYISAYSGIGSGAWEIFDIVENVSVTLLVKNTGAGTSAYLGAVGDLSGIAFTKAKFVGPVSFENVNPSFEGVFAIDGQAVGLPLEMDNTHIRVDEELAASGTPPSIIVIGGLFGVVYTGSTFTYGNVIVSSVLFNGVMFSGSIDFSGSVVNSGASGVVANNCHGTIYVNSFDANNFMFDVSYISKLYIQAFSCIGNVNGGYVRLNSSVFFKHDVVSDYDTLDFTPALNVIAADGSVIYG